MGADIKIRHLVTDGLFLLLFSFFFKLAMLNELQNFMLENGIAVFWGFFHADILLQMCGFFLIYLNRRLIQISYLIFSVPTGIQFLFICNLITVVGSTLYKKYCNFLLFTLRIKYFIGKKAYNENQFLNIFA